jgi:hypothetical protein
VGRQLQLATTFTDEVTLLQRVNSIAPIRVFRSFAESPAALWVDDWRDQRVGDPASFIWPTTFAWLPRFAQTGGPKCPPERAGHFYVANSKVAPVLEFRRSFIDEGRFGRIYWGRGFSAPNGLEYDEIAFTRLVDGLWRWIRSVGRRKDVEPLAPYFLPDAWVRFGETAA